MLPVLCPKPKTLEQKVGNIEIALQAFKEDGVECPGIFASGNNFLHSNYWPYMNLFIYHKLTKSQASICVKK